MTIEGPKTPPEPPLPIVKLVVRILPRAMASRTGADAGARRDRLLDGAVAEGQHGQDLLLPAEK